MKIDLLLTPEQVAELAFGCTDNRVAEVVGESTILAAQQKYLIPVIGREMVAQILQGNYTELAETYILKALALYVKRLLLPSLAAQVGVAGVMKYLGEGCTQADEMLLKRVIRRTRTDADALLDEAVSVMELSPAEYPHYSAATNVRSRVSISSGVVIH